ncbi:hypothetical protein R20943_02793 [Paraburkholderia aspalathi]|jgi:hypothetical protein|nr:hypothetical protein R20943_02793 [Paraburkholderia aspalathi]
MKRAFRVSGKPAFLLIVLKRNWRAARASLVPPSRVWKRWPKNDMSVSVLVRLLEAAGYDLKFVAHGHGRTLEDILAEQRMPDADS